MKYIYLFVALFIVLMSGCFKDDGNYDLKELNQISFKDIVSTYNLTTGDTVKIKPSFHFSKDSIENKDLEIVWRDQLGDTIGTEHELVFSPKTPGYTQIFIQVKIPAENTFFVRRTSLNVKSEFASGWVILSEKNGKSSLGFLRSYDKVIYSEDGQPETVQKFKEYTDLYKNANGKDLGSEPLMVKHYYAASDYTSVNEIAILQNGGQKSLCVNSETFEHSLLLEKEFTDESYPSNFRIENIHYGRYCNFVKGEDGNTYPRKQDSDRDVHGGYFLKTPLKFNGELDIDDFVWTDVFLTRFYLMHDKNQNRMIFVLDYYRIQESGTMYEMIYDQQPTDIINLNSIDKEYICCKMINPAYYSCGFVAFFKEPGQEKFYIQEFSINANQRKITGQPIQYEVPNAGITENSIIEVLKKSSYVFITSGANNDKLCLFDRDTKTQPIVVADFEGDKITAMSINNDNSKGLVVGTESGKLYYYDISGQILDNGEINLLHTTTSTFGKVIDITYKGNRISY